MRKRRPPKRRAAKGDRRTLTIEGLSETGEGIAGDIHIPFALPGEVVTANIVGNRGTVLSLEEPSKDRVQPRCQHFGLPGDGCGGCTLQHLGEASVRTLKVERLLRQVRKVFPSAEVEAVHSSPPQSRRRAKFSVVPGRAGFYALSSRHVVGLQACDVLVRSLLALVKPLGELASRLGKSFEAQVTQTDAGPDLALFDLGEKQLTLAQREMLNAFSLKQEIARLSADGITLAERQLPVMSFDGVPVDLPAGTFLQATEAGEAALTEEVLTGVGDAKHVADLFSGLGTFALPLSRGRSVYAVDNAGAAITSLDRAAKQSGRSLQTEARDLFARPLQRDELRDFDAVVFDPPRAGAGLQAEALAAAAVPIVVAVSCNPATMARDLRAFSTGYDLGRLVLVDQFSWSAHIEAVAVLRRR